MFEFRWSLSLFFAFPLFSPVILAQVDETQQVLQGHEDAVSMGIFAPDGKSAITVSFDQTVRVWDAASLAELRQYTQHTAPVFCLAVSGDGTTLVTGAQDNTLRIWDLPPATPARVFNEHQGTVNNIALSPNGKTLVSVSADKQIKYRSLVDEDPKTATREGHLANILSLAFRNDGAYFATGDAVGCVKIWSPFLDSPQAEFEIGQIPVRQLRFTPNNQQLFTAGDDGVVRCWQLMPSASQTTDLGDTPLIDWSLNISASQAVCVTAKKAFVLNLTTGISSSPYTVPASQPTSVTHAPNASWYGIADRAGSVHLYNYTDGALRESIVCHQGPINAVVSHPDSVRFATTGTDGTVQVWGQPVATEEERKPLQKWEINNGGIVAGTALAFTPDQQHLFCGAADGTIRQWNLKNGELVRTIDAHPATTPSIGELVIAPNSQFLASIGDDRTLRTWNLQDGSPLQVLQHPVAIHSVSLSSDSQRAAVACEDGFIRVWDLTTGQSLELLAGHDAAVALVGYLSDEKTIVSASLDKTLRVSKTSVLWAMPIHQGPILSMSLDSNGVQVLTCGKDHRIVLSNASTGTEVRSYRVSKDAPPESDEEPSEPSFIEIKPTCVAARFDNQRISVGTETGAIYTWNTTSPDTPLLSMKLDSPVTAIAYSPDNQKLAVATAANNVHLFGPSIPGTQPELELIEHQKFSTGSAISQLVFDLDSQSIWASAENGEVQQWRYAGLAQRRQMSHSGPVFGVAISNNGQLIASCSTDATVRIWNATTGQLKSQLRGHVGAVHAIAMSQDETFAVTSGADGTLRLWDIIGGQQLKQLTKFDHTMYSIAINPKGDLIAAAGADRKVHLLDLITGQEQQTLEGHSDYVHCVAFDASGNRLLSYGYAGHLKIWNVADGKLLHQSRVGKVGNYARFSPDGRQLLLSNGDGTARLIPVP